MNKDHVVFDKRKDGKKTLIMAHKGGNFGPGNTLLNFKGAMEAGVEGIEFDIWLTKDEVPVIMHGGCDGTLKDYGRPQDYVFNWTFD